MIRCAVCESKDTFPSCPAMAEIMEEGQIVETMGYLVSCGTCGARWTETFQKVSENFIGFGAETPHKQPFNFGRSTDA